MSYDMMETDFDFVGRLSVIGFRCGVKCTVKYVELASLPGSRVRGIGRFGDESVDDEVALGRKQAAGITRCQPQFPSKWGSVRRHVPFAGS